MMRYSRANGREGAHVNVPSTSRARTSIPKSAACAAKDAAVQLDGQGALTLRSAPPSWHRKIRNKYFRKCILFAARCQHGRGIPCAYAKSCTNPHVLRKQTSTLAAGRGSNADMPWLQDVSSREAASAPGPCSGCTPRPRCCLKAVRKATPWPRPCRILPALPVTHSSVNIRARNAAQ